MATTSSARMPAIAAKSAALLNYLAAANFSISAFRADELGTLLVLGPDSDFKALAKTLRAELVKDGIRLRQSHSLEALSRMAGFTSYMRLLESVKQQAGEFTREGFLLRVRVVGEPDEQFTPYASLPAAANTIIEQVMTRLNIPGESVCCELRRSPQSVVLEVCRAEGAWFTVELLAYALADEEVKFVEFDAESQRTCLERLLRALERGRPGTLGLYGTIPQLLPPWHYASFHVTFHDTGVQKIATDERELFFIFEGLKIHSSAVINHEAWAYGHEGKAALELVWNRFDGSVPAQTAEISTGMLNTLVERFGQWRRGLNVPIQDAILQLVSGSTPAEEKHSLNVEVLSSSREQLGVEPKALAEAVGITEQEVRRIEKFGFAPVALIPALARALSLDPNSLVTKSEGDFGFEIEEAHHLLSAMKNIHGYKTIIPEEFDRDTADFLKGVAEDLQELGDLVQVKDGVFEEVFGGPETVKKEHLIEHAQTLLEQIHVKKLMLIVAKSLVFAKGVGRLARADDMPLHTITFWFQPQNMRSRQPKHSKATRS